MIKIIRSLFAETSHECRRTKFVFPKTHLILSRTFDKSKISDCKSHHNPVRISIRFEPIDSERIPRSLLRGSSIIETRSLYKAQCLFYSPPRAMGRFRWGFSTLKPTCCSWTATFSLPRIFVSGSSNGLAMKTSSVTKEPVYAIQDREMIGNLSGAIHGHQFTGFIGEVYKHFPFPEEP